MDFAMSGKWQPCSETFTAPREDTIVVRRRRPEKENEIKKDILPTGSSIGFGLTLSNNSSIHLTQSFSFSLFLALSFALGWDICCCAKKGRKEGRIEGRVFSYRRSRTSVRPSGGIRVEGPLLAAVGWININRKERERKRGREKES
jgi:hypothetical protein